MKSDYNRGQLKIVKFVIVKIFFFFLLNHRRIIPHTRTIQILSYGGFKIKNVNIRFVNVSSLKHLRISKIRASACTNATNQLILFHARSSNELARLSFLRGKCR